MNKYYFLYVFSLITSILSAGDIHTASSTVEQIDNSNAKVTVTVPVKAGDYIYKEYITVATDHPHLSLSAHQITAKPVQIYDQSFKETKVAFEKPFTVTFAVNSESSLPEKADIHLSYYAQSQKKMIQEIVPIHFFSEEQLSSVHTTIEADSPIASASAGVDTQKASDKVEDGVASPTEKTSFFSRVHTKVRTLWSNWTTKAMSLVQTSNSWTVRIIFVLLLGLLMSLTPCIYPMIPITVGILQSQGSKSVWRNFLLSLSYSLGIATTLALLGLVAAFTKQAFGSLMAQPLFILLVVSLLVYLGLSMIGLYEMYIPRIFQPKQTNVKGGSLLSAYLFGAASGTFASPCLSPGLFLLLTLVTAWGNKLLGFVLLFVFGIGLSIPLLIIGSFSSSLAFLPRAGMWMVEIKRFFGFIILGVAFYFLKNIISPLVSAWLLAFFVLGIGLFYLYDIKPHERIYWKIIKNIIGMGLIASSVFFFARAYRYKEPTTDLWEYDYYTALENAKREDKNLLIDIGAPFCSICKAIDAGLFAKPEVVKQLAHCTTLKIDGSAENEACRTLRDKYSVLGFPTILLIDPQTGTVIKKWGAELYDLSPEEFIAQLKQAE